MQGLPGEKGEKGDPSILQGPPGAAVRILWMLAKFLLTRFCFVLTRVCNSSNLMQALQLALENASDTA